METSERNLLEQPITCSSKMLRDGERPAKTNYTDLIDKWVQNTGLAHTHSGVLYIFVLTAVRGRWTKLRRSEGSP